jgi:hypothetical protein
MPFLFDNSNKNEDNNIIGKIFIDKNGEKYEGDFTIVKNMIIRSNIGKVKYLCGNIYDGQWINNKMHGYGKYISKFYIYEGEFFDDTKEGLGKITWNNGNSYEGVFVQDILCLYYDKGIFTFADGSQFIGQLKKIWNIIIDPDEHQY